MKYFILATALTLGCLFSCKTPQPTVEAEQPAAVQEAPAEAAVTEAAAPTPPQEMSKDQDKMVTQLIDQYGNQLNLSSDQRDEITNLAAGYDLFGGSQEENRQARRSLIRQIEGSVLTPEQAKQAKQIRQWKQGGGK